MWTVIAIIFFLIVLSAFFSGAETALTAASRPLMHQLERKGDKRAVTVNFLHANKEKLIGAILLGNNLVNILASALATSVLIGLYGENGVVYATGVMTVVVLVFAEILPKTYAFKTSNRLALVIAPGLRVLVAVLSPVTFLIHILVRGLLKLVGIDYHAEDAFGSAEEELRGAIELHAAGEDTTDDERAMLHSILDLDDVEVGEIMTHRKSVAMIDADAPVEHIVAQVLESPYTRLPVWQDDADNIVGILHAKALLRALRGSGGGSPGPVDVLSLAAQPWFVPETTSLLDQLQAFRSRHEHFALVVDEYGSLQGIVTLEDILEEIVGDIRDEHDRPVTGVRSEAAGTYLVQGSVTIRDLNRKFDWRLPDEEAATIAGLILHESRRIPDVGQKFRFHGCTFEILRRQRHQITAIRVTPPPPAGTVAHAS